MARISPGDTLRILLVTQNESLREQIGVILSHYAGEHRLFWIAQPELAARRAEDLLPHLVLIDDDLAAVPAPTVTRQLVAAVPNAAVLALVDESSVAVAREAVLNGARGFVMKPLVAEDFWSTVYQLLLQNQAVEHEMHQRTTVGKVITFVGPKGGTGRTMLAVNVAIALLQSTGQSVVMVDADYAAPALDVDLNLEGDKDISQLSARASRLDRELISSVLAEHSSGLRVLLAPPPMCGALEITLLQVEQIVSYLRTMFEWVVVDLGALLDESGFAFLDNADHIIMTVLPELVCLRNTRLMLDQLQLRGYPDERVWLVLNRYDISGGVTRQDIEQRLHVRIKHNVPDDQPLVSLSVNRGVPLMLSHRRSAVARSITELATQIVVAATESKPAAARTEAPAAASNPFSRMFRKVGSAGATR